MVCFCACGSCSLSDIPLAGNLLPWDSDELVLVSYNVQNLFDGVDDGAEYPEFDPGEGNWGVGDYYHKLKSISSVLREINSGKGPDVAVFQELEKAGVLKTLNTEFLPDLGYRFCHVAVREGQSVHVGVLSRVPVSSLYCHSPGTEGRAVLEFLLIPPEGGGITVFVNHWKSRLGGVAATEPLRSQAAAFIVHRISTLTMPSLVCGDLNWDTRTVATYGEDEGFGPGDCAPALGLPGSASPLWITGDAGLVADRRLPRLLFNPWETGDAVPQGSYWYRGEWEAIDHCFLSWELLEGRDGRWRFDSFGPHVSAAYCNAEMVPVAYRPGRTAGCSDHLPVVLRLKR